MRRCAGATPLVFRTKVLRTKANSPAACRLQRRHCLSLCMRCPLRAHDVQCRQICSVSHACAWVSLLGCCCHRQRESLHCAVQIIREPIAAAQGEMSAAAACSCQLRASAARIFLLFAQRAMMLMRSRIASSLWDGCGAQQPSLQRVLQRSRPWARSASLLDCCTQGSRGC